MPFGTDSIQPSGGMNQDVDLSLIPKGEYLSALNVQHITDGGNTSFAIQNTKGNLFRFQIPATTVQNKIYKILMQVGSGTLARQVTIYDAQGTSIGVVQWNDDATTIATTYTNFTTHAGTGLAAIIAATSPLQTYTVSASGNYAIVTLTTVAGFEYSIKDTQGTNPTEVDVQQEAIDASITGEANIIGSYDLLGQLYIWSTSQVNLPSVLLNPITGATNAIPIVVTVANHGLSNGQSVVISGVAGNTAANGTWIVSSVTANTFALSNSVGNGSYTSGGIVTINVEGIGEIGVAIYNQNTDTTTYTTLIKSKEFNFRRSKQIDTYCEQNNFETSLYWTDDYNVPRVLYYSGSFITNGAIQIINPTGKYAYGSIADETKLILTNSLLGFTFNKQYDSGGGVLSGNWRYAVRLLTATFSATNWTELSNPINVYKASVSIPASICGDDGLTVTGKINEFIVSNLINGLFSYIELAGVNYVDGAIVGSIINRFFIDNTTMVIQHTGTETNTTNLDVSTLNQFSFDIETAKNIDAIDSRLIVSNLTTAQEIDFSLFAQSFTHSIKRDTINNIGLGGTGNKFGEYQDPINVFGKVGYMINDVYRFSVRFKLKATGNLTKAFWVNDICISTTASSPVPIPASDTARRVAGLTDWNLTATGANPLVYVPYVEFSGIYKSFLINGSPASDLISEIHFERAERVPEILTTGAIASTIEVGMNFGSGSIVANTEFVGISGFDGSQIVYPGAGIDKSHTVKLYSPDALCVSSSLAFQSGDKVINMGASGVMQHVAEASLGTYQSDLSEYNGFFASSPQVATLSSVTFLADGGGPITVGGDSYYNKFDNAGGDSDIRRNGYVIYSSGTSFSPGSGTDYGLYNAQYYRAKSYVSSDNNKYGNRSQTIYIPTGAILTIDNTTSTPTTKAVFGGDVFTQKTYLKHRAGVPTSVGGGGGIAFYSQNVVNSQMIRKYGNTSGAWNYPNINTDLWLESADLGPSIAPYNKGYTIENGISRDVAFDPSLPNQSDLPTEIRWSDLKPQNSVIDNFRIFLPLNFKDLPLTWGEIIDHVNFNGELFTIQPRMVQRQYFNTRGTMNVGGQTPTEVLIGDGSVMSRDGQMVTTIGSFHKWSVIKGRSSQGNDTLYWINTELDKVMRMGYDGTVSIADIHGMQSFFANNLKWVIGKDTPADGQGICGVWDDRYMSTIWTIRGKRNIVPYDSSHTYVANNIISYKPISGTAPLYSTFEQTGEFYVSIVSSNTGNTPPSFGDNPTVKWIMIPHTGSILVNGTTYNGSDYYNEFTIEFNEQKNKFTTFYSFLPKIYLQWTKTFLTPNPISNVGNVYEHRLGAYCSWYDSGQVVDGNIELVYNQGVNSSKMFKALWWYTLIAPVRVDIFTKRHQTFMLGTDSETENNLDYYSMPVKNDILTSSNGQINSEDTTNVFGEYILIKLTFTALVFQKLVDTVIKFFSQSRNSSK